VTRYAFTNLANHVPAITGLRGTTVLLMFLLVAWSIAGYLTGFPTSWRWLPGTAVGVVACLMVFMVRGQQRRNTAAMHRRLDDLLCVVCGAGQSLGEPMALPVGSSGECNTTNSPRHGGRREHLWLVPPAGCRDSSEPTRPRC
jgi:hypothetical protein